MPYGSIVLLCDEGALYSLRYTMRIVYATASFDRGTSLSWFVGADQPGLQVMALGQRNNSL